MKIKKTSTNKVASMGVKSAPTFKQPKPAGKLKLPKNTNIDDTIIKKTKFDKERSKQAKNNHKGTTALDKPVPKVKKVKHNQEIKTKPKHIVSMTKVSSSEKSKKSGAKSKSFSKPSADIPTKAAKPSTKLLPSTCVSDVLVTKAVTALYQLAEQQKHKNKMFEDEASVFAQIMCIKIQNKRGNIRFCLPHSTVASTGEICLVTPDLKKGRKPDHEPTIEHWEQTLRSAGVNQIKTILPMRQLRVEYDQYELKRRLLTQHDFIMVDSRVLNHVSHILGKTFFKKHNMLIPVRLHNAKDIKSNIDKALKTAILRLNEGPTSTILVGHMGMSPKEIRENILALVRQLSERYPGGEQNIRSLSIKLPLSLALPLYVTLRSKKTVMPPRLNSELPKQHQVVEGELSTFMGGTVKVLPEGTVTLNIDQNSSEIEVEEDEEENPKVLSKTKKSAKSNKKQKKGRSSVPSGKGREESSSNENVSEDDNLEQASDSE